MNSDSLRAAAHDLTKWSIGLEDNIDALGAGEKMFAAADAWEAQVATLRRLAGFLRSVILSGETWTEACQAEYDAALASQPEVKP